jgi:glutathione S-transferase
MLKVWGRLSSINVRKVVFAAQLLELPFERTDAGAGFGIVGSPEYRAMNPNALVPTIEDGSFQLWESNVIVRYLCARHSAGDLYPQALQARFEAERWMDWQQTTLNPAGRDAFLQLVRVAPEKRNQAAIDASAAAITPLLDLLEARLARLPFIAGDRLTMADVPIACEMHRWFGLPLPHPARPHLQRWYDDLLRRPAARGALDIPLS